MLCDTLISDTTTEYSHVPTFIHSTSRSTDTQNPSISPNPGGVFNINDITGKLNSLNNIWIYVFIVIVEKSNHSFLVPLYNLENTIKKATAVKSKILYCVFERQFLWVIRYLKRFSLFSQFVYHALALKSLSHLPLHLWSKTTLNTSSVAGAWVNPQTWKIGTCFLISRVLCMSIFNNFK